MTTTDHALERTTASEPGAGDPDQYRRQLQTVAENATLALFIMDEQQRCSYMNPAAERLTGFRLEELQGQPLHYYIHHKRPDGSHYPLEECPIDRAFPQNMREQGEETFVHKDGHLYPVSFTASPIRQDERIVGTIIEARDVTEDKWKEAERQQLIDELERERARLAEVFERAPAFIATLRGADHVFEMTNEAYARIVGGRNVVGQSVAEALPEVVEQGFIGILDRVRATGEPFVGTEAPLLLRDENGADKQHFVNFVYHPIAERDDTISGIFVHGVDVTDQVCARREVEELKARLDLALDSARIGTWDFDLVTNQLIWDSRTREIFGVAADATVDYDVFLGRLHEEDRERSDRAVQEALTGANDGYFQIEYRAMLDDSSCRWIRASGQTLFEGTAEARKAVRFTGTAMDVTARVNAEAERERLLRETESQKARLQQVFVEAPAVIAMYSGEEHVISMVNPMWETVLGRKNVVGKRVADLFPELAGTDVLALLDQVRASGQAMVGNETEIRIDRRGNGELEPSWWNFVFQPIADDEQRITDIFIHAVEVTDQVRARRAVEEKADELARLARALETSNRELDQFAYVASHDLKAPLRGIANLSQWIEEDIGTQNLSDESREHLALLRGRVHRMEALIDGILQYSRAGRVREKAEQVDVRKLVEEVVDLLAPPPSIKIEVAADLPTIESERLPLQQVFQNLIGNAIKYTRRPDPRITVSGTDTGDHWEFAVRDNGPGIPAEYHNKIFGLFQTLEARDKVEATGIGLSIVQKTVDSRGGTVRIESEPGQGTTFHFSWPKTQPEETRHA
ncbi:MAG TPA: PAS domain S-box protein [Thermoanaerobaculia bacterium]|nr:PAS domain S-box protein [Thermoanaerobaculia bacterium]